MDLPINYEESRRDVRNKAKSRYIEVQDNMCYHCGKSLNGLPAKHIEDAHINLLRLFPNAPKNPIHLYHCHKTDMTIGAVHARCHAWLLQYRGE